MCVYIISIFKYIFDIYCLVVKLVLLQRMEEVCWEVFSIAVGIGMGIWMRIRMGMGMGKDKGMGM